MSENNYLVSWSDNLNNNAIIFDKYNNTLHQYSILEPDAVDFTPVINFDGTITFIWGKYSDGSISSIQLDSNLSAWSWSDVKTIGSGLFSNSYNLDAPLSNENYIILFPYDDNASINYIVVDDLNH